MKSEWEGFETCRERDEGPQVLKISLELAGRKKGEYPREKEAGGKKKKTKQRVNNQVGILEPSCRTHYGGSGARSAPTSPVDNRGDLRCGCRYRRQHRAFYAVKQGDNISGAWELTGHGW